MSKKKEQARVFKLWRCPFCSSMFNHWLTPEEEEHKFIVCPHCYAEVPISRKKMI